MGQSRNELLQEYRILAKRLAEAKRSGNDLESLKAELRRVSISLQQLDTNKQQSKGNIIEKTIDIRVELKNQLADLELLREPWDDLLERSGNYSPFVTWEWWWPWVKEYVKTRAKPHLLIASAPDGRLLGGIPLAIISQRRERKLVFMGSHIGPEPAYLSFPVDPVYLQEVMPLLVGRLAQSMGHEYKLWHWEQCPVDLQLSEKLIAIGCEGLHTIIQVKRQCVHGELPESFEAYIEGVKSKNRRRQLRNQFERLAREWAPADFRIYRDCNPETLAIIRQLAQYNIQRRQSLGDNSAWNAPDFNRCLEGVIANFAARGWLRIFCIYVEGRLAAALMGWVYRGTFFAYQIGETAEHPELGLGHCVISQAIKACIEEGLKHFEFLGEGHPWKRSYFPRRTAAATVYIGQDDWNYWSCMGWLSLRRSISKVLKRGKGGSLPGHTIPLGDED